MKPFDEELVSGNIVRSVWKLAWPIVLMNLINGVHGMIDQIVERRDMRGAIARVLSLLCDP